MISKLANGRYGLVITFFIFGLLPYGLINVITHNFITSKGVLILIILMTAIWLYIVFMGVRAVKTNNKIMKNLASIIIFLLFAMKMLSIAML